MIIVVELLLPRMDLLPPRSEIILWFLPHEQVQNHAHIARQPNAAADIFVDLGGVDVDVDELAVRCVLAEIARLPVGKAAAECDDEIGGTDGIVRRFLSMHPGKSEHLRMCTGDGAHPHQGVNGRKSVFLDECDGLRRCARRDHTAAHDDKRTLCIHDLCRRLGRADDEIRVRLSGLMLRPLLLRIGDLLEKEVTRHIDEHGSRAPTACKIKRLADRRYEISGVLDLVVMLCHGHRHIEDIRLLERIASEHR